MLKLVSPVLMLTLLFTSQGCRKDSDGDKAPQAGNPTAGAPIIPDEAEILEALLSKGSFNGLSRYTFAPVSLILKGYWTKFTAPSGYVYAEQQVAINELEWMLVQKNLQTLRPVPIGAERCGIAADGEEKILTITYRQAQSEKSITVATEKTKMLVCADHYIADETFDIIYNAVREKLSEPQSNSAYKPLPN